MWVGLGSLAIAIGSLFVAAHAEARAKRIEDRSAVQWAAYPFHVRGQLAGFRVRHTGFRPVLDAKADVSKLSHLRVGFHWSVGSIGPGESFTVRFEGGDAQHLEGELPLT